MCVAFTERRRSCTVTVERNRYGAMTLRSETGRTYQVVDSADPSTAARLTELSVDSRVSVRLREAPGRGNTWCVTAVESAAAADRPLVRYEVRQ